MIALLALAGATVLLCIGTSIGMLIAGRALQGISAAAVWSIGLALLVDTIGQRDIAQVLGYVSLSMTLAVMLSPLLGGIVYAKAGYYAVYYMAFALVVLDIALRILMIEKSVADQWNTESLNKEGLEQKFEAKQRTPDVDTTTHNEEQIVASGASSPALTERPNNNSGVVFKRSKLARFPPIVTLLGSYRLLAALWGTIVMATILTSFDTVVPLRTQLLFRWDSTGAGLIFLALVIPSFLAPLVGKFSDRYGSRWQSAVGFLLACPLLVCLRFVDHGGTNQVVLLAALLAMLGFCLSIVFTPLMAEVTYIVADKEKATPGIYGPKGAYAQAYGLSNTAYATGCLVGPLWSGFVNSKAGWGTMGWSLALLTAFSAIPALLWSGGFITKRHDNSKGANENRNMAGDNV